MREPLEFRLSMGLRKIDGKSYAFSNSRETAFWEIDRWFADGSES